MTPAWQAVHSYQVGEILRPSNPSFIHAVVINADGISGSTEPPFDDVVGSVITGPPDYLTLSELSLKTSEDSGNPIPPFAAVLCEPSEKTVSYEDTNIMHGSVIWVTKHGVTNVVEHSTNAKRIYDVLKSITSGYDMLRRITIHGLDIAATNDFTDHERDAHGDVIEFVVGVSANPR